MREREKVLHRRFRPLWALVLISCATGVAGADVPALELKWWVDGALMYDGTPAGTDNGNGFYNYNGWLGGGADPSLSYNITGNPLLGLVSGNLTVENLTANTIEVTLLLTLPLTKTLPDGTFLRGSAALGLTADDGGGVLGSLESTPVWQALIDGTEVTALFPDPFSITRRDFGSDGADDEFGMPLALPGPPALETIGIEISFSLTPLDQASITSVFGLVPGPTSLLCLAGGLALCAGRSRRRLR